MINMLANFFYKSIVTKNKKVVGLFLIVFSSFLFSQEASIIENITETEGLPSNYVFNANEDQNGVIWLGTDKGLATYQDGEWITLDVDNGMPGNYINKAISDKKNGLLIYLSERGLYYFDTNKRRITVKYPSLGNLILRDFKISNYNSNYILINGVNPKTNQEKFYAIDISNVKTLIPLHIEQNSIFLKGKNSKIKLADRDFLLQNDKIVLNRFTLEKIENTIFIKQNGKIIDTLSEKNGLGNNSINHILKTSKNDVIISTLGGGISIIRNNNPKITFNHKSINARQILTFQNKQYIFADGFLYVIQDDKILSKVFLRKDALTFHLDGDFLYLGSFAGLETYKMNGNQLQFINLFPFTAGVSKILKFNSQIIFTTYGGGFFVKNGNSVTKYQNKPFNN